MPAYTARAHRLHGAAPYDSGGDLLFVDLRTEFATEDPEWSNVATMLAEIADALEHGTKVDGVRPKTVDGRIHWA